MKFDYIEGATPLEADDIKGLIPKHITTQDQLNEWEYANILIGEKWAYARKHSDLLSISFIQKLHKKMFNKTWDWAGKFRTKQTNIGVMWHQIPSQLKLLCDDFLFYLENQSYSTDELAIRFHYRIVFIHAFPLGNGRHARIMANLLAIQLGKKPFTWGLSNKLLNLASPGILREEYLSSLRQAEQNDYKNLIKFSRS